jgi:hypothetical protein
MGPPDMAFVTGDMSGPVIEGEHGRLIDYFSNMPLAGLTVTDGANSVTTGADGTFVLPAPLGATLSPVASGPMFASLYLAEATADGVDVNRGDVPMASDANFMLEQSILGNDTSMALVHIAIRRSGACTSLAGGTITVSSPADTKLAYFSTSGLPASQTMFDVVAPKPNAVVYNVPAGATLDVKIDVPGCTQVPFGGSRDGMVLTGKVPTLATEPGFNTAALIFDLQ